MSILAYNIKHLRSRMGYSQQKLANELIITRGRLAKYEESANEPPIGILKRISNYFNLPIDVLVSVDVEKTPYKSLIQLDNNRLLLPIIVDEEGKEGIEIVSEKASAGYSLGYGDPEYIASLQKMSIPFLGVGNYRAFPIKGDSMLPIKDGSYIIGKFIDSISSVKDGKTYIVVSQNDGLMYKRLYRNKESFDMVSDNKLYETYQLNFDEIIEIWEFSMMMNRDDSIEKDREELDVMEMFVSLKRDIKKLAK